MEVETLSRRHRAQTSLSCGRRQAHSAMPSSSTLPEERCWQTLAKERPPGQLQTLNRVKNLSLPGQILKQLAPILYLDRVADRDRALAGHHLMAAPATPVSGNLGNLGDLRTTRLICFNGCLAWRDPGHIVLLGLIRSSSGRNGTA